MFLKKLYNFFANPFTGPILASSIIIGSLVIFIIPDLSQKNELRQLQSNAESSINKLKKIRSYYTSKVIGKVKSQTDLKINYDHNDNPHTIPLPATLLHNLSDILPDNGMKVSMFSNYPFPNRANRVLTSDQKEALEFIDKNPHQTFTKLSTQDGEKVVKVVVADIFYDQGCVNCHNTRSDTPKADWKLGDVRGVLEVILPYKGDTLLTSQQVLYIGLILIVLIVVLGVHYGIVSIRQKNQYKMIEKELEDKIATRTKTLNEYKKAVDFSAIVSKTDQNGLITYVNEEFIRTSKYESEELIGRNHNIIRHPDMPDEIFKDLWSTIKSKKIWKGQIKNRAKDGSSYYVASTVVPITNANDEIEEFLAIRFDISEIVESRIQAEEADKTKSTFLANMSHEIRTPLNAIIGFSQVLNNSKKLSVEQAKQANIIETSANSLLMIINDILDVSKIESGSFQINTTNTDLYFILEHVVELFTKKVAQKNIKFVFNIDSKIPLCVQTDGTRIRQVISNLLSNAIKFTENYGVIYLNVSMVENESGKATVRFEIIDTGIGIPQEKLSSIFLPFMQVDSQTNRKYEGTGLGLSICSHIVESFGSKIEVDSKSGEGSRFWFNLELDVCEEVMFEKSHYAHDLVFGVLDENSDLYHYAKRYLNIFGKIAFEVEPNETDIVIVDYTKEKYEGLEDLRKKCQKPKLVLFEYENSYNSTMLEDNERGIYLPFYPSKINDALQELINGSSEFINKIDNINSFEGKILVAEDNLANQELITYILQSIGIEFEIAANGKEALNMFKNNKYDLVFMDINMPIMDGIEAFKLIREYESETAGELTTFTPVIALTANAIKGDREKFLTLGMNDYLSKPIEVDKLTGIFEKYLLNKEVETQIVEEVKQDEEIEESSAPQTLDASKIASKLGVSEKIGEILISKFKTEIKKDLKELQDGIDSGDFTVIKDKSHYIKNSCLNIGLDDICSLLQNLETDTSTIEDAKVKFAKIEKKILALV